ncbi:hypothetical protein DRF60_11735 [Chryseobacterium elymi]|uniref:Uncharacterized protein n=1 Tax=Chryseobacterium elymi TaxID=395936 RepID=A0A3D9DGJ6_9FLAO|nr:hypothetical protein [Chryseobacterium elymi]REC77086.1 hypothetical protein DRF60_11735 [Chryseobacterium elymi]
MKTISLICLLILFTSCSNKEVSEKTNSGQAGYSFENLFYNNEDTILIKSQFADCGEWGGHEELLKIYDSERKIKLAYIKYKINCSKRDDKGSIVQEKDVTKNFILSKSQQTVLINYMNNLMRLKFIEREFGNSGNFFSVEDSKGKLRLFQYGNNPHLLNNYNTLMKSLGLSKVDIKNK